MDNERLFYLLTVTKLTPDHIKPTHRADALDPKLCYSEFSPALMVLGSRQFPVHNQDLNFPLNFESNLGRPIPDKR